MTPASLPTMRASPHETDAPAVPATVPTPADIIEDTRLERADRVAYALWLSHVYQCGSDCYRAENECDEGRRLRSTSDTAWDGYRTHRASVGLPEVPF